MPLGNPRFIPAWAGNTRSLAGTWRTSAVHPRVGREHPPMSESCRWCSGSSPRGRGTRLDAGAGGSIGRFIPAWAGNTFRRGGSFDRPAVHPRVGGEHACWIRPVRRSRGSSPRGRGTQFVPGLPVFDRRFIPAWAGNTAVQLPDLPFDIGSSPRGRGTRLRTWRGLVAVRFIPAWAGNTDANWLLFNVPSVHPRVGGEHPARDVQQ